MHRRSFLGLTGGAALCGVFDTDTIGSAASLGNAGIAQTKTIVAAAQRFLKSLNDDQRVKVSLPFVSEQTAIAAHFKGGLRGDVVFVGEQYGQAMWSNYPVSDVPRPGLRLGDLTNQQREAAMDLLRVMLSEKGYRKVTEIVGSDQALADSGTPYASGRNAYTLAILGAPDDAAQWMIQFGGHHLALNLSIKGSRGVLAPVLTGALPANYSANGKNIRTLAAENDKAFALFASLDEGHRKQAIINHKVSELVLGPGHDGETVESVGVKGAALNQRQQACLIDLAFEWVGMVNDIYAAPRMAEIALALEDTFFAWSGPETHEPNRNGVSYFRIQGPNLFIEFSPQEPGGDLTMHVHTIYRDLSNGYGRALS
ncbi:MAG TPA: DUF3500 domain-containing protein [Afipia sp.]